MTQKIIKKYDLDLALFLDVVKVLNDYKKWFRMNLIKSRKSKQYILKEVYQLKKKQIELRDKLAKRLKIKTIDSIIKFQKKR